MITLFNEPYKAISNLFVRTFEQEDFCFPAPYKVHATIEDENKGTHDILELSFTSYMDSILVLDYVFSLFFYLLTPDYKIKTVYLRVVRKKSVEQELGGYKGIFEFNSEFDLSLNIGEQDIHDYYIENKNRKTKL